MKQYATESSHHKGFAIEAVPAAVGGAGKTLIPVNNLPII
jgi:hypothetical protein